MPEGKAASAPTFLVWRGRLCVQRSSVRAMYFKLLPIPGVTPESPFLTPYGVLGQLGDGRPQAAYSPVFGIVNGRMA